MAIVAGLGVASIVSGCLRTSSFPESLADAERLALAAWEAVQSPGPLQEPIPSEAAVLASRGTTASARGDALATQPTGPAALLPQAVALPKAQQTSAQAVQHAAAPAARFTARTASPRAKDNPNEAAKRSTAPSAAAPAAAPAATSPAKQRREEAPLRTRLN